MSTPWLPSQNRYETIPYRRCGRSGLKLPVISLGLWHNFGGIDTFENGRAMVRYAFDNGITHFDLANNYGPPPGSAEETFGQILKKDFLGFRDELIISSKAGYRMWDGPYGEWGSRKYLISSLDQSLKRMGLDYVDIFYSHRFDPETPLEETMGALDSIVRSGKALYAGISNYSAADTEKAASLMKSLGTPLLIHQPKFSLFNRWVERDGLLPVLDTAGMGSIPFSPLAQGLLTDKYLKDIPPDSRAAKPSGFLKAEEITPEVREKIIRLNELALSRGQKLSQLALVWILRHPQVTSALIGASKVSQIADAILATRNLELSGEELQKIEDILK